LLTNDCYQTLMLPLATKPFAKFAFEPKLTHSKSLQEHPELFMKRLIRIAFAKKLYKYLLSFTLIASLGLTLATQLEMVSFTIVTKKGVDVFELFSSSKNQETLSKEEILSGWEHLDAEGKGEISRSEVKAFLRNKKDRRFLDKAMDFVQNWIPFEKSVWTLLLLLISASILKATTLFLYRFGTRLFTINLCKDIRQQYFEHIQRLPMSFYHAHNIGALSSRAVNDAYVIADGVHSALVNYFQTPFAVITTLSACFLISWQLSTIIFLGLPVLIWPIIFIAKSIRRISRQLQKKQEAFSSVLIEFLSGVQTIKLYAMEAFSEKKYQEHNNSMARLEVRNARYDTLSRPLLHTIGMFFLVAILLTGLYGLGLSLYEVICYCGLLTSVYEPVKKFSEETGRIQRGAAACDRLFEILDIEPAIIDEHDAIEEIEFTDEIAFNNVSFGYLPGQELFSSLSFKVKKGEMVAIIGPTGGGKSTIVSLLTRLFDPQKGSITIDGKPLQRYTQASIKDFFAVVPQHSFLFHDTIKENIRFGRTYSDEQIQAAARRSHAEEFIVHMPEQYETLLAEAGKSLSGGQQQRLSIARALIKDAPVLILDEATSALDAASELRIKSILSELKGSVTQIVIAHRLSTIENADRIIVIEKGQKVGDGTKEELLASCPTFCRLYRPHVDTQHTLT